MRMLTHLLHGLALSGLFAHGIASAQYAPGWDQQTSDAKLTATPAVMRVIKIENKSATNQAYNLFLGEAQPIAANVTRKIEIRAERFSGKPNEFGLGFHILDASGGYVTESAQNLIGSLGIAMSTMSYSYTATKAGMLRPRISIANIPPGATFSFAVSETVMITNKAGAAPVPPVVVPPIASQPAPSTPPTPSAPTCDMKVSGPIKVTKNGQVIENLFIKSDGSDAILVDGFSNVVIRNVKVEHKGGRGIVLMHAPSTVIENVSVVNTGSPIAGPNAVFNQYNIDCWESPNSIVRNARLEKGSTGVQLDHCPNMKLSFIEGHNFRGPFPRGQLVQFGNSNGSSIEDFSVVNDSSSWAEDNINVYNSSNITIRRGLVDGNNSPSGVGVMIEHVDKVAHDALIEDVDAVHMGNGCFSAGPDTKNVTFNRVRCSDNICTSQQGRGLPMSNGLAFGGWASTSNLNLTAASYQRLCNAPNIIWDKNVFSKAEYSAASFTPRAPLKLKFCF